MLDENEPAVPNAKVQIGSQFVTTKPDGSYSLTIIRGTQSIRIAAEGFRYINVFRKWIDIPEQNANGVKIPAQHLADAETTSISNAVYLEVTQFDAKGVATKNIGLMQGYLTSPIACGTHYLLWSYVDLDYRIGSIRNWAGENTPAVDAFIDINSPNARPGTSDQHQGVDFNVPIGTPILAMASGQLVFWRDGNEQRARMLNVSHKLGSITLETSYAHNSLNVASLGQSVYRGQIIALSGNNNGCCKTTSAHVHISQYNPATDYKLPCIPYANGDCVSRNTDLWRDVTNKESINYWTVDNSPQCLPVQGK
jgi:murein DD-endopeptidase MepM/ murein hydrolase activator NlpD